MKEVAACHSTQTDDSKLLVKVMVVVVLLISDRSLVIEVHAHLLKMVWCCLLDYLKVASGVSHLSLLRHECGPSTLLHLIKRLLGIIPFIRSAINPDSLMLRAIDNPHFLLPLIPVPIVGL